MNQNTLGKTEKLIFTTKITLKFPFFIFPTKTNTLKNSKQMLYFKKINSLNKFRKKILIFRIVGKMNFISEHTRNNALNPRNIQIMQN